MEVVYALIRIAIIIFAAVATLGLTLQFAYMLWGESSGKKKER